MEVYHIYRLTFMVIILKQQCYTQIYDRVRITDEDLFATVGESINFTCISAASVTEILQRPVIFRKDGERLANTTAVESQFKEDLRITYSNDGPFRLTLTIKNASVADAGVFSCQQDNHTVTINIHVSPETTVSSVKTSSMMLETLTTKSSLDVESTSQGANRKLTVSILTTEAISHTLHTTVTPQLRTVKSNAQLAGGANNAAIKSSHSNVLWILCCFLFLILRVSIK